MSTLLQIRNLEMAYGTQVIFCDANLNISEKQKIAVVGRNGAGKSTLFRLIVGEEEPTGGEIIIHGGTRIGYLTQHSPFLPGEKVMDFLTRFSGQETWVCAKVASQFQIRTEHFDLPVESLAGGYQMRVKLIAMLACEPNLLLLDEPTNYLDLSTLLLLEGFLKKYNGAFLLISHDREFIKKTCDQTLEIDQGKTFLFPQSLEEYLTFKQTKTLSIEKFNQKVLQEKERLQIFVDRFKSKASKSAQARSKMKQIEKLETVETMSPISTTRIRIPKVETKKGVALTVEDLAIGYPDKTVANRINFDIDRSERIAIVGDNGSGKTTFLKTIAGELTEISGKFKWGSNISVGYYAQHTPSKLRSTATVKEFLIESASPDLTHEDIFEMAGNFLFKNEALKKEISVLSGGEKARLCLATILLQKNHVLLLDEPTNHLDFETVEALASALRDTNTTVIFVSHNRTFVETLASGIVEVKNGRAARYHHNYENYVYHMQRAIESDLQDESGGKLKFSRTDDPGAERSPVSLTPDNVSILDENDQPKMAPEEIRQLLKKAKNELRKAETTIKTLGEEKQKLLDWFQAHPTEYSDEKSLKLGEVIKKLETAENDWLAAQTRIEELS